MLLIGYQNRVDSKRSHPVRKIWKRKKCWSSFPCSARPNGPLGARIAAVEWYWKCGDIYMLEDQRVWYGVWVYMRSSPIRDVWAPYDTPAAGAIRYGHSLTRRRTREKTGGRTRPRRHISSKIVEMKFIAISGVVVEPRRRYHNF